MLEGSYPYSGQENQFMRITAAFDPVTRIEGHLNIEITIDTVNGLQQVVDAKAVGGLFRGFEKLLIGRDPRDAQHITERICGVCPVAHGLAAVRALDKRVRGLRATQSSTSCGT